MHSSNLTVISVEFSVPRVVTSTLRATLNDSSTFNATTETSWRNRCSQPPTAQTPHTCDQSSVRLHVQNRAATLRKCLKLKQRSASLFTHSLQNPKEGRPATQHVRTQPGHEGFAFDDRRLGTTRRATLSSHENMNFPTQTW